MVVCLGWERCSAKLQALASTHEIAALVGHTPVHCVAGAAGPPRG